MHATLSPPLKLGSIESPITAAGLNISEKTARHIAAALDVPLDELKEVD